MRVIVAAALVVFTALVWAALRPVTARDTLAEF